MSSDPRFRCIAGWRIVGPGCRFDEAVKHELSDDLNNDPIRGSGGELSPCGLLEAEMDIRNQKAESRDFPFPLRFMFYLDEGFPAFRVNK